MAKKAIKKQRLTSEERRLAILEAAVPLFAEVGFRGATTKMVAQRVGVSEALLYQHFPSKEALYEAVQDLLCRRHGGIEAAMATKVPSTETLIFILYVFAQLTIDPPDSYGLSKVFPRVMLQSVMDDGAFARLHLERNMMPVARQAIASVAAARAAGDIVCDDQIPDDLRFWFAHHVMVMIHLASVPAMPLVDYPKDKNQLIDHAMRYTMRGIGLSESAVSNHYDPCRLRNELQQCLNDGAELRA